MQVTEHRQRMGPWPGPVPYDEAQRNLFHGREADLREILTRLRSDRLVLLTAFSGIGKTSFLRAGLIPLLRVRRREALRSGRPGRQPSVLVLRDWSDPRAAAPDEFFIEMIRQAIDDLDGLAETYADEAETAEALRRDAALLRAVPLPHDGTAFTYVAELADAVEGLLLVLDQFEEVLEASGTQSRGIWNIIASLYKHEDAPIRLLLSFRNEFLPHLRRLDREIAGSDALIYSLPEMPLETLRDALTRSAHAGGVNITGEALNELMGRWMRRTGTAEADAEAGEDTTRTVSIDLLKLQALLVELYEHAAAEGMEANEIPITPETLAHLLDREREEGGATSGPELVELALERFLDRRVLPRPGNAKAIPGLPSDLSPRDRRMLERRRTAVRMAPFFSTGSLKVAQHEGPLIAQAWREEWQVLNTSVEEVADALTQIDPRGGRLEQLGAYLGLPNQAMERNAGILSGIARGDGWSVRDTADHLLALSRETLDVLVDGNVIRPKRTAYGWTYELVHDGFGPAFRSWAEEVRLGPLDVLATVVAQRGSEFNWEYLTGMIRDVSWRGCWVGPTSRKQELEFDEVEFVGCDLRGTLFDRCVFKGGAFRDCDLDFVVFQNCTFKEHEKTHAPFIFENVRASGLTFQSGAAIGVEFRDCRLEKMWWAPLPGVAEDLNLDRVTFNDCIINQWSVDNVVLDGPLTFSRSWLGLSDLFGLAPTSQDGRKDKQQGVSFDGCTFMYCPANDELLAAMKTGGNEVYPAWMQAERWRDMIPGTVPGRQFP